MARPEKRQRWRTLAKAVVVTAAFTLKVLGVDRWIREEQERRRRIWSNDPKAGRPVRLDGEEG